VRMEHFDLEDMFGRRPRPVLAIVHKVIKGGQPGPAGEFWSHSVVLTITNSGRGLARAPMLAIHLNDPWIVREPGIDGRGTVGLPKLASSTGSEWIRFVGPTTQVIHPGVDLDVCAITCPAPFRGAPSALQLSYQIAADHWPLTSGTLKVSESDLVAKSLSVRD
jgi:hypothetical protein